MFEDSYKTIVSTSEDFFKDKGSKFLAFAYPISSEKEVKDVLEKLRKKYSDANHFCYAYVIGSDKLTYRINDDGEPSGTAGRPIYGQIQSFDVTNVLVVVVRFFGGTLLGVSGLIKAYKSASKLVLNKANIIEKTINDIYSVLFKYESTSQVMRILKENDAVFIDQKFEEQCSIVFSIRKNNSNNLYDSLSILDNVVVKYLNSE